MSQAKLTCAVCGSEMNRHAMKVDYNEENSLSIDPVFGGVLKEVHTCPACGHCALIETEEHGLTLP